MKTAEIKGSVERQPFRPFAIRLNNGAQYTFRKGRDVGATKDYHILVFFGKSEAMRIDSDSILEIIERRNRMKCAAAPPDDGPPPNGWKQPDAFSNRSRTMCASSHFAESDAACFLASFTDPDAAKFPQRFYRAVSH